LLDRARRYWPEAAAGLQAGVLYLYRARDQLYLDLTRVLRPWGLQPADLDVLGALRAQPHPWQHTPTELYRSLLLSSGGLTKILHRLQAAGLIARTANPRDRRSSMVTLTAAGAELLDRVMDAVVEHERRFLQPLDEDEQEELNRLLAKLVTAGEGEDGPGAHGTGSAV
jgi:DNA-binding MarR family transcriptional regulator